MQLRNKIIKMGLLYDSGCSWMRKDVGIKAPMDSVALFFLFAIGCYLPTLIISIVYATFFGGKA